MAVAQVTSMAVRKPRDSNIELLRIVMTVLTVGHHYVVSSGLYSGAAIWSDPLSWRSLYLLMLGAWGKMGINCFVFITGYYMCKSSISFKKFMKLYLEITLYRLLSYVGFGLAGFSPVTIDGLAKQFLPFMELGSGFVSCYLVFYLFIPFLNVLVRNMTERQHVLLIALLLGVYSVAGSVPQITVIFNYVTWFSILYVIASFIRLHPRPLWSNTRLWAKVTAALVLVSVVSIVGFTWLGVRRGVTPDPYLLLVDSNKIMAVLLAVSFFLLFKDVRIKRSKFINAVASTTFGVLLLHAGTNEDHLIWGILAHTVETYGVPCIYLHALVWPVAVFCACSAIDYLRIRLLEQPLFARWDRWGGVFEEWGAQVVKGLLDKAE